MAAAKFDEYDKGKLQMAKNLLLEVYSSNYGDPKLNGKMRRLETILDKLEALQNSD